MDHENYSDAYIRGIQRMALNRITTAGGTTEAATRAQKSGQDSG